MSDASVWMPLYIGDYLADTMHLQGPAHGAYLLLIMHYWRSGPLPDDDEFLANVARSETTWRPTIRRMVRPFFEERDGFLHHKRIDEELAKAVHNTSKRKAAAHARWEQSKSKPDASADACASDVHVQNGVNAYDARSARGREPSPSPSSSEKEERKVPPSAAQVVDRKEALIALYADAKAAGISGGQVTQALKAQRDMWQAVRKMVDEAATKGEPKAWFAALVIQAQKTPAPTLAERADSWGAQAFARTLPPKDLDDWPMDVPKFVEAVCEAAGIDEDARPNLAVVADWCREGYLLEPRILEQIRSFARDIHEPIRSLKLFDSIIRSAPKWGDAPRFVA